MIVHCVRCGAALEMLPEVYRAVAPDGCLVCPQCAAALIGMQYVPGEGTWMQRHFAPLVVAGALAFLALAVMLVTVQ